MVATSRRDHRFIGVLGLAFLAWLAILFLTAPKAEALAQFARKYKVECSTCHAAFPRLNFFGEQFKRNGYQWPGEPPDGSKEGKEEVSEDLVIDQVGNWLGARLELTPIAYKTNTLTRNGGLQDGFDVGGTLFQFFVAGSIFKDVSVFIEQEFEPDATATNWFYLNFTNILGSSTANLQVGRLSPVNFTSFTDRNRIFEKSAVLNIKSSGGAGENSVNVRSPREGLQYFGYKGPVVWFAGADNGAGGTDLDREKNIWGGARLEVPTTAKSDFEGSSVSFHSYFGTDTASTTTAQINNDFRRYTTSANIRYKENFDFMFVYQIAEDDNYDLTVSPVARQFQGFTGVGAYRMDSWYFILQYDQIDSDDIASIELNKITPSVWYYLRDNFKIGLQGRADVSGAQQKKHEMTAHIRTMF